MSITQEEQVVKVDIDALMSEPCPNCGIKGYVSVGGIGNDIIAKCSLCNHKWNISERCYICETAFVPNERRAALCPDCEAWEAKRWHDHVDEVNQAHLVSVGMG